MPINQTIQPSVRPPRKPWWQRWWGVLIIIIAGLWLVAAFLILFRAVDIIGQWQSGQISLSDLDVGTNGVVVTDLRSVAESADDPFIGNPDAPVVIVEFGDFNCPYCARTAPILKQLLREYPNDIKIIYRDFPVIDPITSPLAAMAGQCAYDQGQGLFWAFHDQLFNLQGNIDNERILLAANAVGLNVSQFNACLTSQQYRQESQDDLRDGIAVGVKGTPSFIINGQLVGGHQSIDNWRRAIDYLLEQ